MLRIALRQIQSIDMVERERGWKVLVSSKNASSPRRFDQQGEVGVSVFEVRER